MSLQQKLHFRSGNWRKLSEKVDQSIIETVQWKKSFSEWSLIFNLRSTNCADVMIRTNVKCNSVLPDRICQSIRLLVHFFSLLFFLTQRRKERRTDGTSRRLKKKGMRGGINAWSETLRIIEINAHFLLIFFFFYFFLCTFQLSFFLFALGLIIKLENGQ